jgi:hypothetical protein
MCSISPLFYAAKLLPLLLLLLPSLPLANDSFGVAGARERKRKKCGI